jgi:tetratricopeptide (TPR) repeat protein
VLRRAALPALCLAVAGCGLVGPPHTGPHGLTSYDADLRRLSAQGRFEQALTVAEEDAGDAGDELLADLNRAIVEHYAGRYEESNARLQAADLEIEERFTKSVSRAALSLLTSDRSLAWLPSESERLMIHVYGSLNYLALGEPDEAAVEARRLSRLLDQLADGNGLDALGADNRRLYRSLRYFTAAVFEQAGERNDADVAYRLAGTDPEAESGSGVVVLVESGFVAHRVERSVTLLVGADELDDLRYGSEDRRQRFARCFSHQKFEGTLNEWGAQDADACDGLDRRPRKRDHDDDLTYLMRVAWPSMYQPLSSRPLGTVQAFTGDRPVPLLDVARDATALDPLPAPGDTVGAPGEGAGALPLGLPGYGQPVMSADVSGAVIQDFNRKAPGILVKSIARAAVKYTVVKAIEDGASEKDETLGDIAGIVGNVFAALTERADTRSWTLLPARLQIVRLDLPPGTHHVKVAAGGANERTLDLGNVEVPRRGVAVVATRAWP